MLKRLWLPLLIIALATACTSGGASTLLPTQTLILSSPTPSPEIPTETPTPSPQPLLDPQTLQTNTPAQLVSLQTDEERQFALLAIENLIEQENISIDAIELAYIERVQWRNVNLECTSGGRAALTDGYHIILIVDELVYDYHTNLEDTVRLCDATPLPDVEPDVRILIDVVASELVLLARQRVEAEFDAEPEDVELLELAAVTWTDNSLGCPVEDQAYSQVNVAGYRIVLSVEDQPVIFHTDFERLLICDADDEVLPEE